MYNTGLHPLILSESDRSFLKLFAMRLTRNEDAAKDLVQDTLLLALKNSELFSLGTNLRAWISTIMRNCFINKYRYNQRRRNISYQANFSFDERTVYKTEENSGYYDLALKDIHSVLNKLPVIFKTPLQLRAEGYAYAEIAYLLGESTGTIKSRIHFARKLLKKNLEQTDRVVVETDKKG